MELVQIASALKTPAPKPEWLKARAPVGENYHELKRLARSLSAPHRLRKRPLPQHRRMLAPQNRHLHDARQPLHPPLRLLRRAQRPPRAHRFRRAPPRRRGQSPRSALQHAVITSVNRDDDLLGGARAFALVIEEIRRQAPGCRVEVLIPDFQGNREAIRIVVDAAPRSPQPQHRIRPAPLSRQSAPARATSALSNCCATPKN